MISIIVPFNNIKIEYLSNIIECLKKQTSKDFEVIFINDNSSNSTDYKSLLREWKYFEINNGYPNPGMARDFGLQKSSGKYIWFIDSDDYITSDAIDYIIKSFSKYDIDLIMFNFKRIKKEKSLKNIEKIYPAKKEILINFQNEIEKATTCLFSEIRSEWRLVFKKQFLIDKKIKHCEKINYFEDIYFTTTVFRNVNNILFTDKILYFYNRLNSNSILNSTNENQIIKETWNAIKNTIEYLSCFENKNNINNFLLSPYIYSLIKVRMKGLSKRYQLVNLFLKKHKRKYFFHIKKMKGWVLINIYSYMWLITSYTPFVKQIKGKQIWEIDINNLQNL